MTNHPENWIDLITWLRNLLEPRGSLWTSHVEAAKLERNETGVWLWLVGQQSPYSEEIERTIELLAQNRAGVLQDLEPQMKEYLAVRLRVTSEWIEMLLVGETSAIEFPTMPFPDFLYEKDEEKNPARAAFADNREPVEIPSDDAFEPLFPLEME